MDPVYVLSLPRARARRLCAPSPPHSPWTTTTAAAPAGDAALRFDPVADACEQPVYDEAEAFFAPRAADEPGFKRSLEKARESVAQCVALRLRETRSFNGYLKRNG